MNQLTASTFPPCAALWIAKYPSLSRHSSKIRKPLGWLLINLSSGKDWLLTEGLKKFPMLLGLPKYAIRCNSD